MSKNETEKTSSNWTLQDSIDTYGFTSWGKGLLRINSKGNVVIRCGNANIDLFSLTHEINERGIELPALVRFNDVLKSRVVSLCETFMSVIRDLEYRGKYRGVFPVKVNQQRHLVEEIVRIGSPYNLGLECGSKPELMIALAMQENRQSLLICNGYKDRDFIEMALFANKMGKKCIIVLEQPNELKSILDIAEKIGVRPIIGVRAKLASKGTGRWQISSGDRAKFGLSISQIVEVVQILKEKNLLSCLQLLHFHIGSQISALTAVQSAIREASRIFVDLAQMGAGMQYLDVGGGLGVDYDGSRSDTNSSINYDYYDYAHTILSNIQEICDASDVPHPTIVTESGRAMVSHSAVLLLPVLGTDQPQKKKVTPDSNLDTFPTAQKLWEIFHDIEPDNLQVPYSDIQQIKEETLALFNLGLIGLEQRGRVNDICWEIGKELLRTAEISSQVPPEIIALRESMAKTYFCNFSIFQSLPDSWAIGQQFPITPIHRLLEEPTERGILVDLTCDSDGKIDSFIDREDSKGALELHKLNDNPYYLGVFLVGAYQESLGDLHNLFGDTNVVHISAATTDRGYKIASWIEGDRIEEVLQYVQYDQHTLVESIRQKLEDALEQSQLNVSDARRMMKTYRRGLRGYTYLNNSVDSQKIEQNVPQDNFQKKPNN